MVSLDRSEMVAAGRASVLQLLSHSFGRFVLFGTSDHSNSWYVGGRYSSAGIECIVGWPIHLGGASAGAVLAPGGCNPLHAPGKTDLIAASAIRLSCASLSFRG